MFQIFSDFFGISWKIKIRTFVRIDRNGTIITDKIKVIKWLHLINKWTVRLWLHLLSKGLLIWRRHDLCRFHRLQTHWCLFISNWHTYASTRFFELYYATLAIHARSLRCTTCILAIRRALVCRTWCAYLFVLKGVASGSAIWVPRAHA